MQDQIYKDIILEHWQNPQNYGLLKNADIYAEGNNPYCGDNMRLSIRLLDGRAAEVGFEGEGCAISKASASLFTEEIKGMSLNKLKMLKPQFVLDLLALPLTPTRAKCALLIYSILKSSLMEIK